MRCAARSRYGTIFRGLLAGGGIALLGSVCPAWAASHQELKVVSLSAAGDLRPGQEITVTWEPLPADTEEFELLLNLEAPVALTLRLTECKDPSIESLSWRVPGVPCDRATLLLRHGRKGREALWGASPPFSIRRTPRGPLHQVALRLGELWICDAPAPETLERSAEHIAHLPADGGIPPEGPQTPCRTLGPAPRHKFPPSGSPAPLPGERGGGLCATPLRTPLRI